MWSPEHERYLGYAGPLTDGPVDLWLSKDLSTWVYYPENPILTDVGLRWPSVILNDGTYCMAARRASGTRSNWQWSFRRSLLNQAAQIKPLFAVRRGINSLSRSISPFPTVIALYTSRDGIEFSHERVLVPQGANGNRFNQNPFLFRDPCSDDVVLLYFSGDGDTWEIHCRRAQTVFELKSAEDVTLRTAHETLAAPAMFYDQAVQQYVLFTETLEEGKRWVTNVYRDTELAAGFGDTAETVYPNDEACAAPFVFGDSLVVFISKRNQRGLFPSWEGHLYQYSLSSTSG